MNTSRVFILLSVFLFPCSIFGQIQIISVTSTPSSCTNNGTATVRIAGGTPTFCYQINGSPCQFSTSTQYTFTGLFAGVQTITVTDGNSNATATVVVGGSYTVPSLTVNVNGCNLVAQPSGGTPPYQFAISLAGGAFGAPQTNPQFNGVSGAYCIRLIDACNNITQFCGSVQSSPLQFNAECCDPAAPTAGSQQMCVLIKDQEGRTAGSPGFSVGGVQPYQFTATSGSQVLTSGSGAFQLEASCPTWMFTVSDACGNTATATASCVKAKIECRNCSGGTAQVSGSQGVAPFQYYYQNTAGQWLPNPAGVSLPQFSGLPTDQALSFKVVDACGNESATLAATCLSANGTFNCADGVAAVGAITDFFPAMVECQSCTPKISRTITIGNSAVFSQGVGTGRDTFLVTDACGATFRLICQNVGNDLEFRRTCNTLTARFQSIYQCNGARNPTNIPNGVTYQLALANQPAQILQTNTNGEFFNLTPGATYLVTASHPNCGSASRQITMYPASSFQLDYELVPTSFLENGICQKGYDLQLWLNPKPEINPVFTFSGTGNFVQLGADKFGSIQPGSYTLNTLNHCISRNFQLPDFPADLQIKFPECPNGGCLTLSGALNEQAWQQWGNANQLKIKSKSSFYILDCPDFNGQNCVGNWDGAICNLLPNSFHTVYLKPGTGTCPVDTQSFVLDLSGTARIDSVKLSSSIACSSGSSATLTVQVFGGKDPLFLEVIDSLSGQVLSTIFDTNGDHQITVPNLLGGKNYVMRVVDDCGNSTDVTAAVTLLPEVEAYFQFRCPNQIRLTTAALFGAHYRWRDAQGNILTDGFNHWTLDWFDAPPPGDFTCEITYGNCPSHTARVNIPEFRNPEVKFPFQDSVLCPSDNIFLQPILSAGDFTFEWNNGATQPNLNISQSGTYQLIVKNALLCADTAEVRILDAPPLEIDLISENLRCHANASGRLSAQILNAAAPLQFRWNDGVTLPQRENLPAGNYQLTVSDAFGCQKLFSATLDEPPPLAAQIDSKNLNCHGDSDGSIHVSPAGGTPPYQFLWENGSTADFRAQLVAGNFQLQIADAHGCTQFLQVSLTQPPALDLQILPKNIQCYNASDGSLEAIATGGTPPLHLLWEDGSTNPFRQNLPFGKYFITLTDANGCTFLAEQLLDQPPPLDAHIETQPVRCFGSATGSTLAVPSGGTPPYQFNWSSGSASSIANNLSAGIFSLILTDSYGCTAQFSTEISQPPALSLQILSENNRCFGDATGTAIVQPMGGTPPFFYLWNTGSTADSLKNLPAGNYSLTLTDANGCTTTGNTLVEQPEPLSILTHSTDALCHNSNDGSATASVSGGTPPTQISWNAGQFLGNIWENLSKGNYSVLATDALGCTTTAEVAVDAPQPLRLQAIFSEIPCFGGTSTLQISATGGTPPYLGVQNWEVPAGNYFKMIVDENGCADTASVHITQPERLEIQQVTTQPAGCFGENNGAASVFYSGGTPPVVAQWSDGQMGFSIKNLTAQQISVLLTDANGCTTNSTALISEYPPFVVDVSVEPTTCFGYHDGAITFEKISGGAGEPYYLNGNVPIFDGYKIFNLPAKHYQFTISDAEGCIASTVVRVEEPPLFQIQIPQRIELELGESIQLAPQVFGQPAPPVRWQWLPSTHFECDTCPTTTFRAIESQHVVLQAIDARGCSTSDTLRVRVEKKCSVFVPNTIQLGTSGTNDRLIFHAAPCVERVLRLAVFDRWGNLLFEKRSFLPNDPTAAWDGRVNQRQVQSGTFVWMAHYLLSDGEEVIKTGDVTILK